MSLAVVLGVCYAWNARRAISPDGISYLDMGDAYLRRDWDMAINGLWSPFYSWLLGLGMLVLKPSPAGEVGVAHLVNFIIYLCALGGFDFLLRQLVRYQQQTRDGATGSDERVPLPDWAWTLLGYPLFIWSSLELTTLAAVTPDMCVAAFLFVAAGMLLRIRGGAAGWTSFAILGAVLGFSYLAKAAMLPSVFVFLLVGALSVGNFRKAIPRVALALAVCLLVGSLYFVPLSIKKGRLTFGDSGLLNYAWYVNKVTLHVHWQGDGGDARSSSSNGDGMPQHPTRKIHDDPAVYEFRGPVRGTYPPWYDPSYWYEGVAARFDAQAQLGVLKKNADVLRLILFSREQKIWAVGFLLLYLLGCRRRSHLLNVAKQWHLLLPPLAALGLFSMVHVEARYTGGFAVLWWLGIFSGVRLPARARWRRGATTCVVAVLTFVMLRGLFPSASAAVRAAVRDFTNGEQATAHGQHWQVAEHLGRIGIAPGDEVAAIGYSFDALWGRLARVRIIAEITSGSIEAPTGDVERFWRGDVSTRARIIRLFAATGAKAIIANRVPPDAATVGWQRIGDTGYYVYVLAGQSSAASPGLSSTNRGSARVRLKIPLAQNVGVMYLMPRDDVGEGAHARHALVSQPPAHPRLRVQMLEHHDARLPHALEFRRQFDERIPVKRSMTDVIVLFITGQRRLVVAREAQRAIREDSLRVDDVSDEFLDAPLVSSITRPGLRFRDAPQQRDGSLVLLPQQRDNVAFRHERNVSAVIRHIFRLIRPVDG